MANVLITGGSGMIGQKLSELLLSKGYTVGHLTRSSYEANRNIKLFLWDIEKEEIDPKAIPWADHIIHLAGETVGQRWTKSIKRKIINSRVSSSELLISELVRRDKKIKSIISASAIGYYGDDTGSDFLIETTQRGDGFLSDVVSNWESSIDNGFNSAERIVKIRIGIVLGEKGGALAKMVIPIKWGVGSPLGMGKQWMSWIHIDDLCNMFLFAIENPVQGIFNGVGPNPVMNKDFISLLAAKLKRPIILPNVPKFVLNLLLGEMSVLALASNRAEPAAFQKEGFIFEFGSLDKALESLIC